MVLFSQAYVLSKVTAFEKLVAAEPHDPVRATNLTVQLRPWIYGNRRVGAPKAKWAAEAAKQYWTHIRSHLPTDMQDQELNLDNPRHVQVVTEIARERRQKEEQRKDAKRN